jgi:hypothetical protein
MNQSSNALSSDGSFNKIPAPVSAESSDCLRRCIMMAPCHAAKETLIKSVRPELVEGHSM